MANRTVSSATLESHSHSDSFKRAMSVIEREEVRGSDPRKLARDVCRLVEQRNPSFRTKVGLWF